MKRWTRDALHRIRQEWRATPSNPVLAPIDDVPEIAPIYVPPFRNAAVRHAPRPGGVLPNAAIFFAAVTIIAFLSRPEPGVVSDCEPPGAASLPSMPVASLLRPLPPSPPGTIPFRTEQETEARQRQLEESERSWKAFRRRTGLGHAELARRHVKQGDIPGAFRIAQFPSGPARFAGVDAFVFASIQEEFDRVVPMLQALDVVLGVDPEFLEARLMRAEGRRRQEDYEGALRDCESALQLSPGNARALQVAGHAALLASRPAVAVTCLELALAADPAHFESWLRLAEAYADCGDAPEMEGALERALKRFDPESPEGRELIAARERLLSGLPAK